MSFATIEDLRRAWKRFSKSDQVLRDPVGHLDYALSLDDNLEALRRTIQTRRFQPEKPEQIAYSKSKGMSRPFARLRIEDALAFQASTLSIVPALDARLTPSAAAMRWTGNPDRPFRQWYTDWPQYQRRLRRFYALGYRYLVSADITAYFENIDHQRLVDLLHTAGLRRRRRVAGFIGFLLDHWVYRPDYSSNPRRGIPQIDLDAPRALANFFLYPVDERLRAHVGRGQVVRWLDDINMAVSTRSEAMEALRILDRALRELGLALNSGKTLILERHEIARHFMFRWNDRMDVAARRLKAMLRSRRPAGSFETKLLKAFRDFIRAEQSPIRIKVLKRFYTNFARMGSRRLLPYVLGHLRDYPALDQKIVDYLMATPDHDRAIAPVVEYLSSPFSFYESTQIYLLHFLADALTSRASSPGLLSLAWRFFNGRRQMGVRYERPRAVAVHLIAKHGKLRDWRHLVRLYLVGAESEPCVKRAIICVGSLFGPGSNEWNLLLEKASQEEDVSQVRLGRLFRFLADSKKAWGAPGVSASLELTRRERPRRNSVRMESLYVACALGANAHALPGLRSRLRSLLAGNQDAIMTEHLLRLQTAVR